jgi:hypothetical protein
VGARVDAVSWANYRSWRQSEIMRVYQYPLRSASLLKGSCHCGRIGVELSTELALDAIIPRRCSCGFCQRHGAIMVSDPDGTINLRTTGENEDVYRFGFETADFHVCADCGVFVAATWKDSTATFGVVNIRVLDEMNSFAEPLTAHFDGEQSSGRNDRRRRNWTPTRITSPYA